VALEIPLDRPWPGAGPFCTATTSCGSSTN